MTTLPPSDPLPVRAMRATQPAAAAPATQRSASPSTWDLVSAGRGSVQPARARGAPRIEPATPTLSVSLHDVAPATWPACERVLRAIEAVAPVRVALLVVPRYRGVDSARDPQFMQAIEARIKRGDEVVLHGWTHVDDSPLQRPWGQPIDLLRRRVYTAGEGEFAALDRMEALRRIHAGVGWFGAQGWPLRGFVAPAWLMSRGARAALLDTPLQYAATRGELLLLAAGTTVRAPSLCWSTRSGLRRSLSPPWNALLGLINSTRPLLRIALHPQDADHDAVRESWQRALFAALQTRVARTEGEVADDWIAATLADPLGDDDAVEADDLDLAAAPLDTPAEVLGQMRALGEDARRVDRPLHEGQPTSAAAGR
jgi:hypothetical protein